MNGIGFLLLIVVLLDEFRDSWVLESKDYESRSFRGDYLSLNLKGLGIHWLEAEIIASGSKRTEVCIRFRTRDTISHKSQMFLLLFLTHRAISFH